MQRQNYLEVPLLMCRRAFIDFLNCLRAFAQLSIYALAHVHICYYRYYDLLRCIRWFSDADVQYNTYRILILLIDILARVQDNRYRLFHLLTCICIVIKLRFCSYAKLPLSNHHFACMQDHIYLQDRLLTCSQHIINVNSCSYADAWLLTWCIAYMHT